MKAIFDNIKGTYEIEGKVPRKIVCEYDSATKTLTVARDKIGEQTLYYAQLPTAVIVSTELKDILPYIAYPKINMLNLAQPIRYNYPIDLQQTWIEQIKRVRAGEELTIDQKGIRSRIYWKRDHTPTFKGTKEEALSEALRLLRKSVKECVESSEGPVAVLLSGGIDSTSLAVLTKEIQQEVHVFSAGYRGNKYTAQDERPVAKRFAEEKGLIYHEVELDVNDFQKYLNETIPYLDEPCFDVNCMVQFALYKKVAEMGFKTVLCGLGGDELFYSYTAETGIALLYQKREQFVSLYPVKHHRLDFVRFVLRNLKFLLWPTDSAKLSEKKLVAWTCDDYKKFASSATLKCGSNEYQFNDVDVAHHFSDQLDINGMYDYMFSTFASTLCVYMASKMSAANGVVASFPLLNPEFVQFIDSIPLEMKFDPNQPKCFQKEMMAGILPDYILNAHKRGFEPPFEFIWDICGKYRYNRIQANHVFFNSMVADMIINNLF